MVRPWVIRGVSAVAATAAIAATCVPLPVRAEGSTAAPEVAPQEEKPIAKERVASFPARGGLIFKDMVSVLRVPDPSIEGVTLFISNVERPITDRISKDFFGDPSGASVCVAQTGPIRFKKPIAYGPKGEEVFSEKKNLFFKATRIRRVYDEASQTLLYISYSTNWSSGTDDQSDPNSRYRTSVAALPLFQAVQPSTQASTR